MTADVPVGPFQARLAFILSVTCLAMLLALSTPVAAQDASDTKATPEPAGEADKAHLASILEEYGHKNDDPLALITAAKLYKELSARVLKRGEEGKDGQAVDPEFLLNKASVIAKNDEIKELAKSIKNDDRGVWTYSPSCYYEWYCGPFNCYYRWICY